MFFLIRLKFKLIEKRPIGVVRSKWREICRKAWFLVGDYWFRNMLKRHFTAQAKYIYKHKPRSEKYRRNKQRLARRGRVAMGGEVDNVFTGAAMEKITSTAIVRGFPTRVKVTMFAPSYFRMRFKAGSSQPNKKREIITTTPEEQKILKAIMRDFVTDQIKKLKQPQTTTIGN